jgi:hypothetical protein
MLKQKAIYLGAIGLLAGGQCFANDCDAALVMSTYNSFTSDHIDWRLAVLVTEKEYEQIKHDEGASAVIYGVPVGESYADFSSRVHEKQSVYHKSLSRDQSRNILWTGLDTNASSAYMKCLDAEIFARRGLHMAVKSATTTDIAVWVSWRPEQSDPSTISLNWTLGGRGDPKLPQHVTQGVSVVVLPRPLKQQTLVANANGTGDSVTLEPLTIMRDWPLPAPLVVSRESYQTDLLASGAGKDFGNWATVCSADKPESWAIVSYAFQITGDRAGGAYAESGLVAPATTNHVCYRLRTQGHEEQSGHGNTGIQNSRGVLDVVWQHR